MKKLFKVNDDYVIASSYNEAVKIYLKFYGSTYDSEDYIESVELVKTEVIMEE